MREGASADRSNVKHALQKLLTIPTCQTLDELRDKLDQSLFRSAKYNPDHVPHRHLSPRKQTGYNLRDKSHNLTLPQSVNATLKQNFVERMVYFWSIPIGLLTKLPYALVTFSFFCANWRPTALVLSPWATRQPTRHGLVPAPPLYPPLVQFYDDTCNSRMSRPDTLIR